MQGLLKKRKGERNERRQHERKATFSDSEILTEAQENEILTVPMEYVTIDLLHTSKQLGDTTSIDTYWIHSQIL